MYFQSPAIKKGSPPIYIESDRQEAYWRMKAMTSICHGFWEPGKECLLAF